MSGDGSSESHPAVETVAAAPSATVAAEGLRHRGHLGPEQMEAMLDEASRWSQVGLGTARRLLDVCLLVAEEAGAPEARPTANYLLARLTLTEGRPQEALQHIEEARSGWISLGRPTEAARTELGRMHVLDELGRHGEAAEVGRQLLSEVASLSEASLDAADAALATWIRGAALENVGVALGLTGRHNEALTAYADAEKLHLQAGNPRDVARIRGNQGVALTAMGRPAEALEAIESAMELFAADGDELSMAMCQSNMVEAELLLGRYAAALDRAEPCRRILVEQEAWPEVCRLQLRVIRAALALNLLDLALETTDDTRSRLTQLGLRHDLAQADWMGAAVELRLGRFSAALELAERSSAGAIAVDDPALHIKSLLTTSEVLVHLDHNLAAVEAARCALDLVAGGNWPAEALLAHLQMASLVPSADVRWSHLKQAQTIANQLRLPNLQYLVLLAIGRLRRFQHRLDEATLVLTEAISIVEQLRWLVADDMLRATFLEHRTEAHAELIGALLDGGTRGAERIAFTVAEGAKARTLGDILAGAITQGPLLGAEPDCNVEAALPLTAAGLPRSCDQVVEYHVVDRHITAFVWAGGDLRVVRDLAPVETVNELVGRWQLQLRRRLFDNGLSFRHQSQLVATANRVLRDLWRALFAPVVEHLDSTLIDLIVVPHGPLHAVPFHALTDGQATVGATWDVVVAASYAVANSMRSRFPSAPSGRSLVMAVPDDAAPAMGAEAAAVASVLPDPTLLVGAAATRRALFELAPSADTIHLACHGLHHPRNPMFSSLRLADRWITARDVLSLDLNQPMVVLSACESGRQGGGGDVDEAIGFARSFVAAGAAAVVVSLWLADDAVTAQLMQVFYAQLALGRTPARALGMARAAVAVDHPHPADWGSFVLHGPAPNVTGFNRR